MTVPEFQKKVQDLCDQLDNKDVEVLIMVTTFEQGKPSDVDIIATGCLVCHSDALETYIDIKDIQHMNNAATKVH